MIVVASLYSSCRLTGYLVVLRLLLYIPALLLGRRPAKINVKNLKSGTGEFFFQTPRRAPCPHARTRLLPTDKPSFFFPDSVSSCPPVVSRRFFFFCCAQRTLVTSPFGFVVFFARVICFFFPRSSRKTGCQRAESRVRNYNIVVTDSEGSAAAAVADTASSTFDRPNRIISPFTRRRGRRRRRRTDRARIPVRAEIRSESSCARYGKSLSRIVSSRRKTLNTFRTRLELSVKIRPKRFSVHVSKFVTVRTGKTVFHDLDFESEKRPERTTSPHVFLDDGQLLRYYGHSNTLS